MEIYHGTAIAKEDIGEIIKKDEKGFVSAYLPEEEIFAVFFNEEKWITFKESEEEFLKRFDIVQEPEFKNK